MEDIVNNYRKMAIGEADNELNFDTEEAGDEEVIEDQIGFLVVGTVISDRKVNFEAFQDAMTSAWRPGKGISIKEIDEKREANLYTSPIAAQLHDIPAWNAPLGSITSLGLLCLVRQLSKKELPQAIGRKSIIRGERI
ncbi:unnamed protein product [Cuscuta epithymum]|uniref:Uncharacterized protein n=1 Tax=Cuscuta epithymum TaxID=186058 RepID=A0AAV0EMH0_9ASTE|nr:unnamed protein product [Cuscuta epithymum]